MNPELRHLAAMIQAGEPMPDPEASHGPFHAVLDATRAYLQPQPSARSVRAAGLRLQKAIAGLVEDEAKARQPC